MAADSLEETPNPIEPGPAHFAAEEDMSSSSENEESDLEFNDQASDNEEEDMGAIDSSNILPEGERLRRKPKLDYKAIDRESPEDPQMETDPDYNPPSED